MFISLVIDFISFVSVVRLTPPFFLTFNSNKTIKHNHVATNSRKNDSG